jgi:hypothetical protein
VDLVTGADGELGEDLVQVVFDGARAHEQLGGDVGVGQAVAGQPGDLGLPGGEPAGGVGGALADPLAGGQQLPRGSFGEPVGAHRGEHLVRGAQLPARVDAPVLPAEPLTVQEAGAGQRHTDAGAGEPVECLAVPAVGRLALADQRPRAGLGTQRPVRAASAGSFGERLEGGGGPLGHPAPGGGLDQLDRAPQ